MDDLIWRQDAIDAIKEFQHGAAEWKGEQEERSDIWHRADSAIASAIEIKLRVKKIPSAQHKPFCYLDSPCPYQNEEIKVTQKKGHWVIKHEDYHGLDATYAVCSECGERCSGYGIDEQKSRFCRWCGADMRRDDGEVDMRGEKDG